MIGRSEGGELHIPRHLFTTLQLDQILGTFPLATDTMVTELMVMVRIPSLVSTGLVARVEVDGCRPGRMRMMVEGIRTSQVGALGVRLVVVVVVVVEARRSGGDRGVVEMMSLGLVVEVEMRVMLLMMVSIGW